MRMDCIEYSGWLIRWSGCRGCCRREEGDGRLVYLRGWATGDLKTGRVVFHKMTRGGTSSQRCGYSYRRGQTGNRQLAVDV